MQHISKRNTERNQKNNLLHGLTNEYYNWVDDNRELLRIAEKEHDKEMKQLVGSDIALVNSFPDELETVMQLLIDSWREADELYAKLQEIWRVVDRTQADSFTKWFYKRKTMFDEAQELIVLQKKIQRLERLKKIYEKKRIEEQLSHEYFKTKKDREQFDIDKLFARQELLADILSYQGVELKKRGKLFRGLCPFHNEKSPSFFVYADNWFHCYGCSKHGNFIDYLIETRKLTFREALEEANRFL